ncbi:hypothetical protein MTO96_049946, partial [Rhipicephalus appendiculatus]
MNNALVSERSTPNFNAEGDKTQRFANARLPRGDSAGVIPKFGSWKRRQYRARREDEALRRREAE